MVALRRGDRVEGRLATIGRARAVADLRLIRLSGFHAWVTWPGVHLWDPASRIASRPDAVGVQHPRPQPDAMLTARRPR
jgi:hypothetical protein